jgi:hypothetical protein
MENTSSTAPKRSRRSQDQWHAILTEHLATEGSVQELAEKLGCRPSTIEFQLKRITSPDTAAKPRTPGGFVEVSARATSAAPVADALRLQTATGVTVTFAVLPPPEYLAAALGLGA